MSRIRIAQIGAITCRSGIATVINTVANSGKLQDRYDLLYFNTTRYKDGSLFMNFCIFFHTFILYFINLMKKRIELAHIHTSFGRSFYRKVIFIFISSLFKVKIILHFHTGRFEKYFIDSTGLKRSLIKSCLNKTDAVVVLCSDWKLKLEKAFFIENIFVIHNPLSLDYNSLKPKVRIPYPEIFKILYFGFIIKAKGVFDILEISQRLQSEGLKHEMDICGMGEEETELLSIIKRENLEQVKFLGWVSGDKRTELLENCDIFLLPSYFEGINSSILEAMAYGMPIITTNVGGTPEAVLDGENGCLLEPGNIEGFISKLKVLMEKPELRMKMGERSREIIQNFRREKISEDWHLLYQRILKGDEKE